MEKKEKDRAVLAIKRKKQKGNCEDKKEKDGAEDEKGKSGKEESKSGENGAWPSITSKTP